VGSEFRGRMRGLTIALITGLMAMRLAMSLAAAGHLSLEVNGKIASSDIRIIDGRAYVPLSDVARLYNQQVIRTPGGYRLIAAGGAHEVGDAHTGAIGKELFTGKWGFKVVSVERTDQYKLRYDQATQTVNPVGPGDTLIVVNCRLKNGMLQTHRVAVGTGDYNGDTGLTDGEGHAYAAVAYDLHHDKDYYAARGTSLLPGAATDLALVFSVPKAAVAKQLVFSIMTWDSTYVDTKHPTDVRIVLSP